MIDPHKTTCICARCEDYRSALTAAQAEVAELRRELEQQRELAKHRGDSLVKQLDATLAMRRAKEDAESRAYTPAERETLKAVSAVVEIVADWLNDNDADSYECMDQIESALCVEVAAELARRATREQPAGEEKP